MTQTEKSGYGDFLLEEAESLLEAAEVKMDHALRLVRAYSQHGNARILNLLREHAIRTKRLALRSQQIRLNLDDESADSVSKEARREIERIMRQIDDIVRLVHETVEQQWSSASKQESGVLNRFIVILTVVTGFTGMSQVIANGNLEMKPKPLVIGMTAALLAVAMFGLLFSVRRWLFQVVKAVMPKSVAESAIEAERKLVGFVDGEMSRLSFALESVRDELPGYGPEDIDPIIRLTDRKARTLAALWTQYENAIDMLTKEFRSLTLEDQTDPLRALEGRIAQDWIEDSMLIEKPIDLLVPQVLLVIGQRGRRYVMDDEGDVSVGAIHPVELEKNIYETLDCLWKSAGSEGCDEDAEQRLHSLAKDLCNKALAATQEDDMTAEEIVEVTKQTLSLEALRARVAGLVGS